MVKQIYAMVDGLQEVLDATTGDRLEKLVHKPYKKMYRRHPPGEAIAKGMFFGLWLRHHSRAEIKFLNENHLTSDLLGVQRRATRLAVMLLGGTMETLHLELAKITAEVERTQAAVDSVAVSSIKGVQTMDGVLVGFMKSIRSTRQHISADCKMIIKEMGTVADFINGPPMKSLIKTFGDLVGFMDSFEHHAEIGTIDALQNIGLSVEVRHEEERDAKKTNEDKD